MTWARAITGPRAIAGPRGAPARFVARIALALAITGACSAPATLSDLTVAERRADAGDVDGAIVAYRAAQVRCRALRPARRARAACGEALLGEAEAIEHAGRTADAIAAYLAIPPRAADDADPAVAATALYRAGALLLARGDAEAAWTALWRVVAEFPDEPIASDALRTVVADGRRRAPRALADELAKLLTPLADTELGDNLVWAMADLDEHELANPASARALLDRIPVDYPRSGLRDDARWHAARLSRLLGDPRGAVARLRALVATREVAFGTGSYFSVWLDDAQLELGRVLRDDLHELAEASAAFRQLPADYPASILRDDALFELAATQAAAGDRAGACASLAELARAFADSKYVGRGPELGCPR